MVDPIPLQVPTRAQLREERLEILQMLEAGTITTEEAVTLLEALDRPVSPADYEVRAAPPPSPGPGHVRIRVTDATSGRTTINLAFPLALIESGLDIAGQFVPEYLPKVEAIRDSVRAGFRGALVDIDDGSQRVEIVAE